jgi:hypothetical protein
MSLHYLTDIAALDSAERAAARDTDWYKKLSEESWFRSSYLIYDRVGDRFTADK